MKDLAIAFVGLLVAFGAVAQTTEDVDDLGLARGYFGDLNGDGNDDVLLRHVDGRWLYYPMDGAQQAPGRGGATLTRDRNWRFAATGDFDGDGKDDVLLRKRDGGWYFYPMDGRRSLAGRGGAAVTKDLHWRFVGVGDFNGDGRDDVLLRHTDGRWIYYAMAGRNSVPASDELPIQSNLDWRFAGIGDLNGDGRSDVLLRHVDGRWLYYPLDGERVLEGNGYANLTRNRQWQVAGLGDFDGDGKDDVLLRHVNGRWFQYPMDGRSHVSAGRGFVTALSDDLEWQLGGIGDLNGDGRADVVLRHVEGRWHYYAMRGREATNSERASLTPRLDWQGVFADGASAISTSGWLEGVFANASAFKDLCAVPRTGLDAEGQRFPDRPGSTVDENNYLRSWSDDTYLWYDEIADRDPGCCGTEEYFGGLRTFARTGSGKYKDQFHYTEDTAERLRRVRQGVSAGYGARYVILASRPPRSIRIAYTEPGSPAAAMNFTRGATVLAIDGEDMIYGSDVDTLNAGLFPATVGETHEFVVRDLGSDATRTFEITSAEITSSPVLRTEVLETESGPVGYLVFNRHIATADTALVAAVRTLADADVTDLIVDLRYNGGGYLDIANHLGYMVAGQRTRGRTFSLLQFNDKHRFRNPINGRLLSARPFFEFTTGWFDAAEGISLPTLNLPRVFVIVAGGTCSASEVFLNSMVGIGLDVVLIGSTTCGKPYGFYPRDNCGTTYSTIQFRSVNDANFGDFADGFAPANLMLPGTVALPGCGVADDFDHALGDPDEARLAAALAFRRGEPCPPVPQTRPRKAAWGPGAITDPSPGADGEAIMLPFAH